MISVYSEHAGEELLERYLTRQTSDSETAAVETHLLICDCCQERLDELEGYRSLMRDAFARLASEQRRLAPARLREALHQRGWLPDKLGWIFPRWPMMTAAAVLALIGVLIIPAMRRAADPLDISLTAERGGDGTTLAAPQRRNLQLHLNSAGLPDGEASIEIVDSNGKTVSEQQVLARSSQVTSAVSGLARGLYYVRVYTSKESHRSSNRLLREFALQVR